MNATALHRHARAGSVPPEFEQATQTMHDADAAAETARNALHRLLRQAYANGVGTTALARWSGYSIRRVSQIVTGR